tara:strand:- start:10018 stop:11298 length:1281 start_codon:yes stop_codon:yes gene_type:complete
MSIEKIYKKFLESSGIVIDSRKVYDNCMFFALKGPNFNGNEFAKEALNKGASCCIVDEKKYIENDDYIYVNNSLKILQNLANFHRKKLKSKIIGITGSNGKTTTKELINSVLSEKFKTSCTEGNLNNHIGVPISLLKIENDCEIAIIEMGANHKGEIALLSSIAQPDFGYITNFGRAHIEGFGSEEDIIKGKCELYDFLKTNNGLIFYNHDDAIQNKQLANYSKKYSYGENGGDINYLTKSYIEKIVLDVKKKEINSSLFGKYNIENIMAAISIGYYFGISLESIGVGVKKYKSINNRSQLIKKEKNTIILDAYNANPTSMMSGLKYFNKIRSKNKVLVLGDMYELGSDEVKYHQEIIDYCEKIEAKSIFLIGSIFRQTKFSEKNLYFESTDELIKSKKLKEITDSMFFVKGSRGVKLEKIINYIS